MRAISPSSPHRPHLASRIALSRRSKSASIELLRYARAMTVIIDLRLRTTQSTKADRRRRRAAPPAAGTRLDVESIIGSSRGTLR